MLTELANLREENTHLKTILQQNTAVLQANVLTIESQNKEIESQGIEIERLEMELRLLRQKTYGPRSERMAAAART